MFVKTCKNSSSNAIVGIVSSSPYFSKLFEGEKEMMMYILYLEKKGSNEEEEKARLVNDLKNFRDKYDGCLRELLAQLD